MSAVTPTTVTISGPSRVLQPLLQLEPFFTLKPIRLPINSPYHAPHIYGPHEVDAILAPCDQAILYSYGSKFPLISSAAGRAVSESNYGSLLQVALNDDLIDQLRWDNVLKESAMQFCDPSPPSPITIYQILNSAAQSLASSLSRASQSQAIINNSCMSQIYHHSSSSPSGKPEQSKIAIIGYGGRFPDAESIERFWSILHICTRHNFIDPTKLCRYLL